MTTEQLIDTTCDAKLALSGGEIRSLQRQSAERQAASGIIGPGGLGIYVKALFDLFKTRVEEAHSTVIRIAESNEAVLDADGISRQVDTKIRPFLTRLSGEVSRISHAPFSPEEPYLEDVYGRLKASFDIEVQLAVARNSSRAMIGPISAPAPDLQKPYDKRKFVVWAIGVLTAIGVGVVIAYIKGCFPGILK